MIIEMIKSSAHFQAGTKRRWDWNAGSWRFCNVLISACNAGFRRHFVIERGAVNMQMHVTKRKPNADALQIHLTSGRHGQPYVSLREDNGPWSDRGGATHHFYNLRWAYDLWDEGYRWVYFTYEA